MNTKETNPPAGVTTLDRFETWFKANHHTRLDRKMADGSYNDPTAYAMWQAWQAGSIDVAKAVNAQQAERIKALPVLPETNIPEGDWFVLDCYIKEYAQTYGAACAAHARRTALEEAAISCEAAMARIVACPKSGENEAVIPCLSHRASVIRNLKERSDDQRTNAGNHQATEAMPL